MHWMNNLDLSVLIEVCVRNLEKNVVPSCEGGMLLPTFSYTERVLYIRVKNPAEELTCTSSKQIIKEKAHEKLLHKGIGG